MSKPSSAQIGQAASGPTPPEVVAGDRRASGRGMVLFVTGLALLMASIDQTIVATGLHTIGGDLHASVAWTGWTITAYAVGIILALPVAGGLTNRFGARRVLVASVALFTVASLCCGLADNIYLLVGLRVVQAFGGAGFTPAATGIIVNGFGSARDKALGMFGSILPIGTMIGPVLGGVLISSWSWRAIFLVNVPIGVVLIPLCLRYLPRTESVQRRRGDRRVDLVGIVLLGSAVLAGMTGAATAGKSGQSLWSPAFVLLEAAAVAAFGLLFRHLRHARDPLIPLRLIAGHGFGTINLLNFLFGVSVAGLGALIPLYATERYGMNALEGGTLLTGRGIAVIVLSGIAVALIRRTGYRMPLLVGCLLVTVGTVGLAMRPIGVSAYTWLAVASAVIGMGAGWSNPASRNASMQLAPEDSALISALRRMSRQVGSISSVSVTTAIVAQSAHPGQAMAHVFLVFAIVMIAATVLVVRVPEHFGSW